MTARGGGERGGAPRIALVGDVSPDRSGAGSLLLYRLLKDHPTERLRVVAPPGRVGLARDIGLPGVRYEAVDYALPRLLRNRYNVAWPLLVSRYMRRYDADVLARLDGFTPDVVVSVAHSFLWFTAVSVARRLGVPFYLFLHDDWGSFLVRAPGPIWDAVRAASHARNARIFRRAAGLFTVSPGMADDVRATCGVDSVIVYPSRGEDSPAPRVRVTAKGGRPPVVVHTGLIHVAGTASLLGQVASELEGLGGFLDLYTQHSNDELAYHGLARPNVRSRGFFPAAEMGERVGSSADALFLTASFEEKDRRDVSTLFPSKLADYTAIGLPIVIWGPRYSSAVRWADANPGSALVFTDRDARPVRDALVRLASDEPFARSLATGAIEAGQRYFELADARARFFGALDRGR